MGWFERKFQQQPFLGHPHFGSCMIQSVAFVALLPGAACWQLGDFVTKGRHCKAPPPARRKANAGKPKEPTPPPFTFSGVRGIGGFRASASCKPALRDFTQSSKGRTVPAFDRSALATKINMPCPFAALHCLVLPLVAVAPLALLPLLLFGAVLSIFEEHGTQEGAERRFLKPVAFWVHSGQVLCQE